MCVTILCVGNKTTQQFYKISTPCIDDHHLKEGRIEIGGRIVKVCFQILLKYLYLARIGKLDILWSVNKHARFITKLHPSHM